MTQGRGGLLGLPRMALPSTTLLLAHWRLPGLNTRPARTPTNASQPASRLATHSSGPTWFAIPLSYDSCIRYTSPLIPALPPCILKEFSTRVEDEVKELGQTDAPLVHRGRGRAGSSRFRPAKSPN